MTSIPQSSRVWGDTVPADGHLQANERRMSELLASGHDGPGRWVQAWRWVGITTQRHKPTSLARSCSVLRVELSSGRRDARSPHHGQSLTSRNTARFFRMHCAASLRICRGETRLSGVHCLGKGRGDKPGGEKRNSLKSTPAHAQHRPGGGSCTGTLWSTPWMGCPGGYPVLHTHPRPM